METAKAVVDVTEEERSIKIVLGDKTIWIPITSDNPKDVKAAFNILIGWARKYEFQINFEGTGPDLYSQVALEYVTQLNGEIKEVRSEMEANGLVDS